MSIIDILYNVKKVDIEFESLFTYNKSSILTMTGNAIASHLKLDIDNGPWLAGGSVRKCFLNQPIGFSDWDIFFRNEKQFEECKILMHNIKNCYPIYESKNAITFQIHDHTHAIEKYNCPTKVQLICRNYYETYQDLLDDFDFTICQFVTDGTTIKLGESTYLDIVDNVIKLTSSEMINRAGFMTRMIKYISYGYKPSNELLNIILEQQSNIDFTSKVDEYEF